MLFEELPVVAVEAAPVLDEELDAARTGNPKLAPKYCETGAVTGKFIGVAMLLEVPSNAEIPPELDAELVIEPPALEPELPAAT